MKPVLTLHSILTAITAVLLVSSSGMVGCKRTDQPGNASLPPPVPIRIIAIDDRVAEPPSSSERQALIHAVIIKGSSWVTFDGSWRPTRQDEESALDFAIFEGKRRGATSLQLAFNPRYDEQLKFFIYDSVKVYEPDGKFVYAK